VRQRELEIHDIQGVLSRDPDRYADVGFNQGPWGAYYVEGTVGSLADLQGLRQELIRILGQRRTEWIWAVEVSTRGPADAPKAEMDP
jgi:hypothetical protein